jgi:FkbM family methyltransferase
MKPKNLLLEPALYTLMVPESPWKKSPQQRAEMTMACKDADYLPRVKDAGESRSENGIDVQVMHNGLIVKKNGYQGKWQAEIIKKLRGVHEPQEEKVFFEVLKRINNATAMIELGSWWSYYSMWFLKDNPKARVICGEPDPINIELGKANMKLNDFELNKHAVFYSIASGFETGKKISFKTEAGKSIIVPIKSVDSIIADEKLNMVDILHFDIQGAELDTLHGAKASIKAGKIRFVFISTHHYSISEDPIIHQRCVDFIKSNGGNIVANHGILESCSGDGLIVASFDSRDKDFTVDVTLQPTEDSLFRPYEYDIDILWGAHNKMLEYVTKLEKKNNKIENELIEKNRKLETLEVELSEIAHLKDHIKRQVKIKIDMLKGSSSK